jgi:excisionase family DNA binding protein
MAVTEKAIGEQVFRSPWLNTDAAAAYLSASPKTLAVWRSQGRGPRYRTCGGRLVLYHRDDLDAFVVGSGTVADA